MDLEGLKVGLNKYYPNGFRKQIADAQGCSEALVSKVLSGKYKSLKPGIIECAIEMLNEAMEREKNLINNINEVSKKVCPECYERVE